MAGSLRKVLDTDSVAENYVHLRYVPPGGAAKGRRLHLSVNETFYFTYGDFPSFEYDSPQDIEGRAATFTEGTFMDRMPHSIHGREPEPESVTGCQLLIWTSHGREFEADPVESIQIPYAPDATAPPGPGSHPAPVVIDSHGMAWRDHPQTPGIQQKVLSAEVNTPGRTPQPVMLLFLPPGWPEAPLRLTGVDTRAWVYCLTGGVGMTVNGEDYELDQGAYLRWQPGAEAVMTRSSRVGCQLLVVGHEFSGVETGD